MSKNIDQHYMLDTLKEKDVELHLILLYLPKIIREDIAIILNFHLELSKIRSQITEDFAGNIRLLWWREVINNIYDKKPQKHSVLTDNLYHIIHKYGLEKSIFLTIIETRKIDLNDLPFKNFIELNDYIDNCNANILRLCVLLLKHNFNNIDIDDFNVSISIVAKIIKYTNIVKSLKYKQINIHKFIPIELQKNIVNIAKSHEQMSFIIQNIVAKIENLVADLNQNYLENANLLSKTMVGKFLYMQIIVCIYYIHKLKCNDYDILTFDYAKKSFKLQIKLMFYYFFNKII